MANKNVPTPAPINSDDQILPFTAWTFLVDKANLGNPTKKAKKRKPHVIIYSRFTKLIIYYLWRHHNIHQRSGSPLNLTEDGLSLGNLKFVPKGEIDEVFGMKIPEELITDNIRNAPYYNAYLVMVAKHEQIIAAAKEGGQKKTTPKANKPMKPTQAKQAKPATAKQPKPKPVKEKSNKLTLLQKDGKGKGKAIATEEQAAQSLLALCTPKRKICETPSPIDAETGVDTEKVINEEEQIAELDEGQAGSVLGKTPDS
nr:hypothetical protein [Tanacetum cinerariifolium]